MKTLYIWRTNNHDSMHRLNNSFQCFLLLSLLGTLGVGCQSKAIDPKQPSKANPATIVDVMVAHLQDITNVVEANGTVLANEAVELRPEVTGRLTYLNVPEGKMVQQGTVLARINSADLQAQLQKSRTQLDLAQINEKRLKTLLEVGGVNQADYDAALNQVNSLKADMEYTQTLIDKTVIKAPFNGIIGLRQVSPGAYVSSATIIATLQTSGKVKIDFTLPEEYDDLIKIGGKVQVQVDASSEERENATIIAMEPQANTQTRNLSVRATLDKGTANPGAFVKVYVGATNRVKAIMVPTNVIIPDDRNNQLIVVKKGKALFVNIKTGLREESNVQITDGVKVGDTVVVTGVLFARPNGPVKVRGVKTLQQLQQ